MHYEVRHCTHCGYNLRGLAFMGRAAAVPTYFFMLNMAVLLGWGLYQLLMGHLPSAPSEAHGMLERIERLDVAQTSPKRRRRSVLPPG